jgi:hypothetical protein
LALQSQFFRDDPKLEAAAVSDPAHILSGASGEHVRKIQLALNFLDGANIVPDGVYGPATAAAVLAYKQKRNIINRSYQTTADNIVGKMTMAALDAEMLAQELKPLFLFTEHPISRVAVSRPRGGAMLAFNISSSNLLSLADLKPFPVPPAPNPLPNFTQDEVIIARGSNGTIRVVGGKDGTLSRSQGKISFHGRGNNLFQVAKLQGAKTSDRDFDQADVLSDDSTHTYEALNCGECFFQARVSPPQPPAKISNITRVLSLVDKSVTLALPPGDYSPQPNFKTGFLSKEGTPLNPKLGRKINVFGEGESAGFEDYSTDIDFCSHSFSNGNGPQGATAGHRPWTADPRTPPGIASKSIPNICCRGSFIAPVTIAEILRIGASKARVTYAEAKGRANCEKLRRGLSGATLIEEGSWGNPPNGFAVIFELA